jgi:tripartite ATP-independent transporter DctM subunit
MIIYGLLAEVSIAKLFVAGLLPGLMIAGMFSLYLAGATLLKPSLLPNERFRLAATDFLRGFLDLLPLLILILAVLGSIYSGIATPSEAAAVGVVITLGLAMGLRVLSWQIVIDSLSAAVRLSTVICIILISASFLSTAVAMLQFPAALTGYIGAMGLSPFALLLVLTVLYLVLGCFLEGLSMMVLTLPLALPLVVAAGWDPLWFGIYLVIMIELATITPPVGFNLFVIQALSGQSIGYVARAALPFFLLMCLSAALIAIFPEIVLIGPQLLLGP